MAGGAAVWNLNEVEIKANRWVVLGALVLLLLLGLAFWRYS